jgi:glycosyltransferase involved in cell wall biosynthesis
MRIALLTLTRGSVSGGFRKYLDRLVPLLRGEPGVEAVEVFLPPQMASDGGHTWPRGDEMRGFRGLRRAVAALDPDVVFIPTGRFLRFGDKPVVTMIRNMEPLEVPFGGNTLKEALKNIARAAAARAASRHSDRVLAVSGHVRDFLVERWRIPPERVGTVVHGVDPAEEDGDMPESLARFAGTPFLFTAGSIRPARGLEDVIEAMSRVPSGVHLVIGGAVDAGAEHYERKMKKLAESHSLGTRVHWAGRLDARAMSWCFSNAAAFVMTSRAEACPNIVLEALAQGAVSISTTHAPMPEFFGDAATYYRERDAGELANRLAEVLAWPAAECERLRRLARARAARFTWPSTAAATVAELRRAVENSNGRRKANRA